MKSSMATLAIALLTGCGSVIVPNTEAGPPAPATNDAAASATPVSAAPPQHHRPSAEACSADRRPGSALQPPPAGSTCVGDAECTAGVNGRCMFSLSSARNACSYDACTVDGDCGAASACECRVGASAGANTCFRGNCRVDADCGAQKYCSPSATNLAINCQGLSAGSIGYFCHAAQDECVESSDCAAGMTCLFSATSAHWTCAEVRCPR